MASPNTSLADSLVKAAVQHMKQREWLQEFGGASARGSKMAEKAIDPQVLARLQEFAGASIRAPRLADQTKFTDIDPQVLARLQEFAGASIRAPRLADQTKFTDIDPRVLAALEKIAGFSVQAWAVQAKFKGPDPQALAGLKEFAGVSLRAWKLAEQANFEGFSPQASSRWSDAAIRNGQLVERLAKVAKRQDFRAQASSRWSETIRPEPEVVERLAKSLGGRLLQRQVAEHVAETVRQIEFDAGLEVDSIGEETLVRSTQFDGLVTVAAYLFCIGAIWQGHDLVVQLLSDALSGIFFLLELRTGLEQKVAAFRDLRGLLEDVITVSEIYILLKGIRYIEGRALTDD